MATTSSPGRVLNGEVIRISLTRTDVVHMQLEQIARRASAWTVWSLFVLGIALAAVSSSGLPRSTRGYVILAASALLGGTLAFVLGIAFVLAVVLLMSRVGDGLLGEHVYTFQADGLHEEFSAGSSFLRWASVRTLRRSASFILIAASPRTFHLIPRRYFEPRHFDDLWTAICAQHNAASRG